MKLIAILITNNATAYGGAQPLRQVVLLVYILDQTDNYDGNGMRYEKKVNGVKTNYYYDGTQLLMESKDGKRTWYILTMIYRTRICSKKGRSSYGKFVRQKKLLDVRHFMRQFVQNG
jgi:hypothetical protein